MAAVPRSSLPPVFASLAVSAPANRGSHPPALAPRLAAPRALIAAAHDRCDDILAGRRSTEAREIAAAWLVFLALAAVGATLF